MFLDIFISIFSEFIKEPIMEFVVVPIKRHISYPFTYKSKVEKLHHESEKLKNRTVKLQQAVEAATRKGEEIYESVNKWLNDAGKAIEEAEECIKGEEQAKKRCFVGLCPDLKTRYQLSKKAEKKALAIHELASVDDHNPISFLPPVQQIVAPPVYAREGLNSRELFLEKVMDALLDPDLNMIGVYGLGGVGKTTLAEQVHRKALEGKRFGVVAMVAVGQTPELRRIQSEIADILGLEFKSEEIPGRANRLYERLKKELEKEKTELEKEKKVLIILDDVWKKLDLNAVGIPFGDGFKGCKILLTSRRQDVLSREMGTQQEFKLDVLQDEEARSLFEITVAGAKDSELPPIAAEIAKKCAGLPLLLLTVATDLRNREPHAWKDKLKQLSEFDNEEIYSKVHAVLKSSYNNLCSNEVKSFFLLCGLIGQSNIEIQSLLKYIMGLSLFKNITVEDARNKVYSLIDTLKAQSLLQDGDMYGFVKIHDVVRDTALSIASREQHAFVVTSGKEFVKFPNKDCTRISLQYCDIENLPEGWECPKAEALFLFTDVFCLEIPDQFFKGIRNLEVVDFTGIHFVYLPSSLAFLSNLHTLCLHRCQLDDLGIIGDLKQLRVLSFANSNVVELPRKIEQLARLKVLDVSNCSKLKMIPANALSKLSELEELYMSNSFVEWEADGNNASLAELEKLSQLTTLEMQILDDKILPKHLFSNGRLQSFRILIGDNWDWKCNYKTSRTLKLKLKTSIHSGYGIKVLLRETEDLCLDEVREAENLLYDIDGDGFPKLKYLRVQNNHVIQHIINSTKWAACDVFPILVSLILENLMKLEKICHGRLTPGSFNKLEILQVRNCGRLTHLFSLSTAKCLLQLQEMKVEDCPKMEAIVIDESENSKEVLEFNRLRSLNLQNLPNLRTFHSKMKTPLKIEEFLSQQQSDTHLSLFSRTVGFPNLERLRLSGINELKRIWHSPLAPNSFFKLKSLNVFNCQKLMVVFPSNVLERFRRMEELHVSYCASLQEIYQLEGFNVDESFELRSLNIWRLRSLKHVWKKDAQRVFGFQNLKSVEVFECDILNWTHIFECQKLTTLNVYSCHKIIKFSSQEIQEEDRQPLLFLEKMSPNLEELTLEHKDLIAIQQGQFFSKLKMLTLINLQNKSCPFIIGFLERLYSVETILVKDYNSSEVLEELFSYEGLAGKEEEHARTLAPVKNLKLEYLFNLKHIWDPDSGLKPLLQYLETLTVSWCSSLINVAPSSSSFQNLATLQVSYCAGLANLITASTAKSMVHLTKMSIQHCSMMTEIVTSDGDDHTEDEIINFDKLKCLELDDLPGLISFCSGNNAFNFPALENVTVNECSRMKIFAFGDPNTPKLRGILLGDQQRWEGNLNATLAEMTFCKYFKASEFPEFWHDGMQGRLLRNVERLEVDKCAMYNKAIPSNVLVFLNKLEELEVKDCDSADVVFDLEGVSADDGLLPRLKKLELTSLPMLRHLWNKDPIGILEFKNLKWLHVGNCSSLKYIFTWSMALCLLQLEKIELNNCKMIEGIIEKEETEEAVNSADKMILHSLKSVVLKCLPRFSRLCSGWSNVECPLLEEMSIHECPSLKNIFATQTLVNTIDEFHKMFPNLEKFSLDKKSTITILGFQFPTGFFSKVKVLELSFFLNKYHVPLFSLLPIFPNLERFEVLDSSLNKLLPFEGLVSDQEDITIIPQIRDLKLKNLPDLKHIWNPDGQLHDPLFQSLETFEIEFCGNLIVLAPSSVSLGNLKTLKVYGCNTLANIFTSAAAKSMVQLETLIVRSCNMLTEIMGGVQEDGSTDEIAFSKMKTLELEDLQNLTCFCFGSYTFNFPSLEQVTVFRCPKLRIFTVRKLSAPKIHGVFIGRRFNQTFHWEGDLNATIEQIYMKYIGFEWIDDVQLSNFPMLKEKWHGQFPFENLRHIRRLVVDECAFFSNAISSNLLKHLSCLNELAVERCDSVEELFDLEGLNDGLVKSLKELRLIDLPRLRHVWNKDPQGILSFRNLTLLKVENCSSLTNIFTLSMASGLVKLKHLELKRCNLVEHIITKEAEEEIAKDNTIFPAMESMSLECLPNLSSFYSASDVLKCPSLKRIEMVDCPNMELLASKFCKEHDLSMIAEGNGERIAASSDGKVSFLYNK
ncbi:hypothetical protein MANES_07G060300v8 [Manihot esculenta]|uniref:Uncharacterized protein n=1 Tax=Manihot esculenta TaxID=3983 RepID=A0ACB7HDC1_MANES|nr:hypothetical protein MANES_07G060300v8 [Manihot esculenta]